MKPAPVFAVRLLGEVDLHSGPTPVPPLESGRVESLLAYLLLHRDAPVTRQRIAFALWPDSTEPQARTNLRHVLHHLRRALVEPDRYLDITPRTLQWRPRGPYRLDVAVFDDLMTRAEDMADDGEAVGPLREAVELYRGDLLAGCYDEWLEPQRQRLRGRYLAGLWRLANALHGRGEQAEAARYAEQLLSHDPLAEPAYQLLMQIHEIGGDRARAVRTYHACVATMERELGTQPSAATRGRYERLVAAEPEPLDMAGERVSGAPLVGRTAERARLVEVWRAASAGTAQAIVISGEAGIGKTRLLEEFRSWCGHHGAVTATAAAYAAEGPLAYGLIVSWLRTDALAGQVRRLPPRDRTELARLLPELLADDPDLPEPQPLPEAELRQRLFDAVARCILDSNRSLLLIADDVHWSDRESLRLLHYLVRTRPTVPLLVAMGVRTEDLPDRQPLSELVTALEAAGRLTEIPLDRFDARDTGVLAAKLTGRTLSDAERDQLYAQTEGNALFVVETVRAGWSTSGVHCGPLTPRVRRVISARLAQLSRPARDLLGLAATIGRDFTVEVLADAANTDNDSLVGVLDELWRRRIIREHGNDTYDFTHDKIREVAYEALTPARRRHHHRRITQALRRRYADDPSRLSAQLAGHFERAGDTTEAIDWYSRAADAAQQLHAGDEAVRLLRRARDLLSTLPDDPRRDARELDLLTTLAAPLAVVHSYAAPELTEVQQRALTLTTRLGRDPSPPLLRSLAVASLTRGDFSRATQLGTQLATLGQTGGDHVLLVESDYVLGIAAFWRGRFPTARRHFEAAVSRYHLADLPTHLIRYGLDPRVLCQSRLANTLWFLGRHADAIGARDTALRWADEINHPPSRATALVFAANLCLELRDGEGVRRFVAAMQDMGGDHYARVTLFTTDALAGYVDVLDGQHGTGLARIRRVLDQLPVIDPAPGARASLRRIQLAACAAAGDAKTGLALVDEALTARDGVGTWSAELHRVRAEFLVSLGAPAAKVAAELDQAHAIADCQGAALFALRAAASRVRWEIGEPAAARERLTATLGVLDCARGTPDWVEAATLTGEERPAKRLRNASTPSV